MKIYSVIVAAVLLSGCATVPKENPITITLSQPVPVVQFELETFVREKAPATQIKNQTDHMLIMTNDCINLADMNASKCALVMMGVGNSGWSGPFHIQTYRFVSMNGKTVVRADWNWCAVNAFGAENCMQINPAAANGVLRKLETRLSVSVAGAGVTQ